MDCSQWNYEHTGTKAYASSFEEKLDILAETFGEPENRPSDTIERGKRPRIFMKGHNKDSNREYADGRRQQVTRVVLLHYRGEDDIMHELGQDQRFERLLLLGNLKEPMPIDVGKYRVEVVKFNPRGGASNYEFYVRWSGGYQAVNTKGGVQKKWTGKIMHIVGRDIWSYIKSKLPDIAMEFFNEHLNEIPDSWRDRLYKSFEPEELEIIKKYLGDNAHAVRLIYEQLIQILTSIKKEDGSTTKEVIGRDGLLPKSPASAAQRILLSMAGDGEEWETPPKEFMQMGALTSAGPRIFNKEPGYYTDLCIHDVSSMYPFLMSIMPGPNACEYRRIPEQPFVLDDWRGQWFDAQISGESFEPVYGYRPIRVHNPLKKRLHYIRGKFEKEWVSGMEILLGVLTGRLRVDHIHDGVHVIGNPADSIYNKYETMMYDHKEKYLEGSILYSLMKLLMNAPGGKAQETNKDHQFINSIKKYEFLPAETHYMGATEAFINGDDDFDDFKDSAFVEAEDTDKKITFGELVDRMSDYHSKAGFFYNPVFASLMLGAGSAIIGLYAYCTEAIAAHTDCLYIIGPAADGFARAEEVMQQAGFPMPTTGMGTFKLKAERAHGYLATGGLYYVEGTFTDPTTGEVKKVTKQGVHGIIKRSGMSMKQMIKEYIEEGRIKYETGPYTLRLKQAYIQGETPGTRKSRTMTLTHHSDNSDDLNQPTTSSQFHDRLLQEANRYLANSALKST